MTRKDYEVISRGIRKAIESCDENGRWAERDGVVLAAQSISIRLGVDNPDFDAQRFLEACGVEHFRRSNFL
jgi:hypothetical protein